MDFTKIKSNQRVPSNTYDLRRELWLLTYASNSCKLVHKLCNFAITGSCQEGDTIYTGIINAIYVSYGRPFHWCRNVGRLTEVDIPSETIALHNEIIHLRDKLYAHKDLEGYQVESEIFNTVKAVVLGGRISMISNELIPRGPKIISIKDHVKKLVGHFDNKAISLLNKLRGSGWPIDGEYILNMDAFSDDIFIPVPESEATALVKRMAEPTNSAEGKAAEWYLVVFVDILGQTKLLRQMKELPAKTDPDQMQEFADLLKKTVGTVKHFRDLFHTYFKGASGYLSDISKLTPDQKKIYNELKKSNPLQFHMFSDFIALFLSLRDDGNKVPMNGVYSALTAAASSILMMLAGGRAVRGGIDIGVGVQLEKGEIYGAALSRAYELESKIATYPRIVLGDEIVKYIQVQQNRPVDDVFASMNKNLAEICSDLITIDDDGFPFLDYLGKGFKRYIASSLDAEIVERAYSFIVQESEKCRRNKNTTLAFRYTLLRDYFEHRMENWRQ